MQRATMRADGGVLQPEAIAAPLRRWPSALAGAMVCAALLMGCGDRSGDAAADAAASDGTASGVSDAAPATTPVDMASATPAASPASAAPEMIVTRSGQADRIAPPVVPPVERDGIRYAQADDGRSLGFNQVGGVLVATDVRTGQRLWALPVYTREIDPKLEADVQWVFFKSMAFAPDGDLLIENESGQKFRVNVQQKTVTPAP